MTTSEADVTLRELPAEEAAVRRYVEELWLPYQRSLEATVEEFALVDEPEADIVDEEVTFRTDRLESDDYELVVAVESLATTDGDLVGFVGTEVEAAPSVFDRPDRLAVGDIYVDEAHRGTGLAERLMAHAADRADREGCGRLRLDVDVGNGRALSFYERLGFEPYRHRMRVDRERLVDRLGR